MSKHRKNEYNGLTTGTMLSVRCFLVRTSEDSEYWGYGVRLVRLACNQNQTNTAVFNIVTATYDIRALRRWCVFING
jgi:predicted SPOUT superfamily RNA methylase MTH1